MKKIDTWSIFVEGLGRRVPVKVSMGRGEYGNSSTTFYAVCEDPKASAESKDIDKLREKIEKELEKVCAVEWRSVILVEIEEHDPFFRSRGGDSWCVYARMQVTANTHQIATIDGKKVQRSRPSDSPYAGWPEPHETNHNSGRVDLKLVIDDTPAHREALEAAVAMLQAASGKLRGAFASDRLKATLKSLAAGSFAMLPKG